MHSYSEAEMLQLWKTKMNLQPALRECVIERADGVDIDELLTMHIRLWYANLLETAPAEWLPQENFATILRPQADDNGRVDVVLPSRSVRPVVWKLQEWKCPITEFHSPESAVAKLQQSPYMRGNPSAPVGVLCANKLCLFSATPSCNARIDMGFCVVKPETGEYLIHKRALSTIPTSLESLL